MLFAFAVFVLGCVLEEHGCTADVCYPERDDFDAMCSSSYSGKTIGPRCFFQSTTDPLDWSSAWAYCRSRGAVLAQVHTAHEAETMRNFTITSGRNLANARALIAMRDENLATGCAISGAMKWYDNETTPNQILITGNTYLGKYHACEDGGTSTTAPRCFTLAWCDEVCGETGGWWWAPICQITNTFQNFSKTNSCMTETPVETVPAANNASDCATECAYRIWCRSYNFVIQTASLYYCQLFSRSVDDCTINAAQCPSTTPGNSTCFHYNTRNY